MGGADTEVRDGTTRPGPRGGVVRAHPHPSRAPRARPEHRGELSLRAGRGPLECRRGDAALPRDHPAHGGRHHGGHARSTCIPWWRIRPASSSACARVKQVLGLDLGQHEVERCLVAIGATVVAKPDDARVSRWTCRVGAPTSRPRSTWSRKWRGCTATIGCPTELRPFRVGTLPDAPAVAVKDRIRHGLVAEGLSEVVSLPFTAADGEASVTLLNPACRYRRVTATAPAADPGAPRGAELEQSRPRCPPVRGRHRVRAGAPAGKRPVEQLRLGPGGDGRPGARSLDLGGRARRGRLGPEGARRRRRVLWRIPVRHGTLKVITSWHV